MSAADIPYPLPPAEPAASPAGVVTADLPCRKCSYNLRGLSLEGRCPECGAAVGLSVQGDLLRYSDPTWVRKLQRGAKFIVYGVVVIVLGVIAGVILGMSGGIGSRSQVLLTGLVGLLGYGLIVVGSWLLTEPDPSGIGEDQYGTSRKIIRIALAVGVLNMFLDFVTNLSPVPPGVFTLLQVLQFAFGIVGIVGLFAQLQYLKKIALRIPDAQLAGRAHFLTYAIAISYGLLLLLALVMAVVASNLAAGGGGPGGGVAAFGCGLGIVALVVLVFFIMYLMLIERLGKRFGDEAAVAERSWAPLNAG